MFEQTELLSFLLALLSGLTAAYGVFAFWPDQSAVDIELGVNARSVGREGVLWRVFDVPIATISTVISTFPLGNYRERLGKMLVQGGLLGKLSVDEFLATSVIGGLIGLFVGVFFDVELSMSPIFLFLFTILGIFYPRIWLDGAIKKRRRRIFRDLPDTLDILRLAVEAGLDLGSALKVVVEQGKSGPLLDELEKVERDITLGRSRQEALKNFAARVGMTEVNAFVVALVQADQLGASIGPILKVQGEVTRTRRWQLAEEFVNKLPMKMLGPLVLFIFPASFIVLFTPLVIQYMQSE